MERHQLADCSTSANHQVLDLAAALQRLRGDRQLLLDLIAFFLEDYPNVVADIHRSVEEKETRELARAAHSLKGLAANFDAREVVDHASTIEQWAKDEDFEHVASLVPPLELALNRLVTCLCNYRDVECG